MILDRTYNTLRNIFWGLIEKIVLLLLPFITRTVLIKVLGAEYVGLNSLFISLLQVLSISELGIGTAIVFSMYKPIAQDDNETMCALLNFYRKIYHIVGSVILFFGLLILPFISYFVKGDIPSDVNLYSLYIIFLFNTVISYFLFSYKGAIFSAFQRNDIHSRRNTAIAFFSNIMQIILLLTIKNYYAYVLIIPIGTILTNLINAYYARKMYPHIICKGNISTDLMKDIKKRIIGLLSYKIYNVVYFSVDTIIISAFLGLMPLALYNNYMAIINTIFGFLSIISTSLTAGIGNKMICDTKENNYIDFKNLLFMYGWISSFLIVLMVCTFQNFINVWLGRDFLLPFLTVILLIIHFMISTLITTFVYIYRTSAGLWWEDKFRPLIQTFANLILNIILINYIGLNGVILSTLLCSIFIAIPWGTKILFKYYFKISQKEYYKKILFYILTTIFTSSICFTICEKYLLSNSLISLFQRGFIVIFISNILFWIIYHKQKEYKFFSDFTKQIFKKNFTNF